MSQPTLSVENISKQFNGIVAIDDLSLTVPQGEVLGLIGPTGAGKSTLIRIIGGIVMPDSGDIYVNGISLYRDYERCMRETGIVPDQPAFYNYMTGRGNLKTFAAMYRGVNDSTVNAVVERLHLEHCIDTNISTWASGDLQRLSLAAALIHSPSLLVMDEALTWLDPVGVVDMRRMLRRLAMDYGITVIVTASHMTELERMCDRLAIMDGGKVIASGTVEQFKRANCAKNRHRLLLDRPDEAARFISEYVRMNVDKRGDMLIVDADQSMIPNLMERLYSQQFLVYEVAPVEMTLEEAYYYMLRKRSRQQRMNGGGA
ncbi:MAG: ABC transporter ATP-binding protein [Ruminococcaceae bacterium]|nr:ABC transporter ATP-binding protein [Oscillospiraceae bacterium]